MERRCFRTKSRESRVVLVADERWAAPTGKSWRIFGILSFGFHFSRDIPHFLLFMFKETHFDTGDVGSIVSWASSQTLGELILQVAGDLSQRGCLKQIQVL